MLSYSWKNTTLFIAYAVGATAAFNAGFTEIALPFTPIGTLGTAVAILLAFHNQAAYDRWWTARKSWSQVTANCRSFAASVTGILGDTSIEAPSPVETELLHRQLAQVFALRNLLRDRPGALGLAPCLDPTELAALGDHDQLLSRLASTQIRRIRECGVDPDILAQFMDLQTGFLDAAEDSLCLKTTPLPRQFGFVALVFVWVLVLLLPMGFVEPLGWGTVPLSVLISVMFVTLEQAGRFTEDPFDGHMNDVPIDALTRSIERDLRGLLNEPVPPELYPVDDILM